jgi:hypothetical protein
VRQAVAVSPDDFPERIAAPGFIQKTKETATP